MIHASRFEGFTIRLREACIRLNQFQNFLNCAMHAKGETYAMGIYSEYLDQGPAPRVVSLLVAVGLECGFHLFRYIQTGTSVHDALYLLGS